MLRFHHRIDPNKPKIEYIEQQEIKEEEEVIPLPESNYVDLSIDDKTKKEEEELKKMIDDIPLICSIPSKFLEGIREENMKPEV